MPKYDPFQNLRTITVVPNGQSLINRGISVEPKNGNTVEITNSLGLRMNAQNNTPIRVIITEGRKGKKDSIRYTLTNGQIKTNNGKTLEIIIPEKVKLAPGKDYSVQFPKEVLRSVGIQELLKHFIRAKLKK